MKKREKGNWLAHIRLLKYKEDIAPFEKLGKEAEFHKLFKPFEIREIEGNLLLNEGIDEMWDLVCGTGSPTQFSNANAYIGVGDSSTAAAAAQTGLQAASNKLYKAMETGYPTTTTQKATFKSSFGDSEANFAWNEWTVANGNSDDSKNMNRKVESLGTKSSGTWTLEVSITLS
jgi:hypothetical protein